MYEWVLETPSECWHKDLFLGIWAKYGREPTEQYARICPDRGFRIGLHLGEESKEVVIQDPVGQLIAS